MYRNERNQTMKRIFLALLSIIVVLGLFSVAGYAGYRFGYAQGVQATANGAAPQLRRFDHLNPRGMPNFGMDREFPRGFGPGRFPMRGFGFFSPFRWLGPLFVLGLIALFVYWFITRSGWRLTRQTTESVSPSRTETSPPSENE
jgi:hypothetical protein